MSISPGNAWRCTVCGYVHRGPKPSDCCPVCGAEPSEFEPYTESAAPPAQAQPQRWRWLVCNYVHSGTEPPGVCPVCGALKDEFEPVSVAPSGAPYGATTNAETAKACLGPELDQIAKAIGAMCVPAGQDVEGILLCGELSRDEAVVRGLRSRLAHILPVSVVKENKP